MPGGAAGLVATPDALSVERGRLSISWMRSSSCWLGVVSLLLCAAAPSPGFAACLTDQQLAWARAADSSFAAFRSSNVSAPPLFWLSSDRTFAMGAMVYRYNANADSVSKLHLLLPLLFYRTPTTRTRGSFRVLVPITSSGSC